MSDVTPSGISDADWIGHDDGPESRWLPISTAPKDGTTVIIWIARTRGEGEAITARPVGDFGWRAKYGSDLIDNDLVTHWMPCPKGPE